MPQENWYEVVSADTALTQGDFILNCPVLTWQAKEVRLEGDNEAEILSTMCAAVLVDAIVLTQACDLEQRKVNDVILCPHFSLTDHENQLKEKLLVQPGARMEKWGKHCDNITAGRVWNLSMLNYLGHGDVKTDHRVVDFHYIYSLPRVFLESLLLNRRTPRLRLLPPYREHLSQAFARYFMRVGLPMEVQKVW